MRSTRESRGEGRVGGGGGSREGQRGVKSRESSQDYVLRECVKGGSRKRDDGVRACVDLS